MRSARFQLFDLAAVVAVGVLGLSVAMPVLARARSAARAASCSDNFKMMGLALHNYHSVFNQFPPGRIWADPKSLAKDPKNSAVDWGVGVMMLPFLDESRLYNSVNFSLSWHTAANRTACGTKVAAYLCPEDVQTTRTARLEPTGQPTNIAFPLGSTAWVTLPGANRGPKPEGIFFDNSTIGVRDIIDGTSNTVLASEQLIDQARRGGPGDDGDCVAAAVEPKAFSDHTGTRWVTGHPSSNYFNGRRTPNDSEPDCFDGVSPTGIGSLNKVPRSRHEKSVHVLLADGSVRIAQNGIDLRIWQALLTRSGQEPIDSTVLAALPAKPAAAVTKKAVVAGMAIRADSRMILSLELETLLKSALGGTVSNVAKDGLVSLAMSSETKGRALTEGHYAGVIIAVNDQNRINPAGVKMIRATVTEIGENTVAFQVGPVAARELKNGQVILLVRPPGTTTAQLREVPDLVRVGGEESGQAANLEPALDRLRQIGLALRRFHDAHGCFPPAVVFGPDRKPWHSWRVLILPYLDQEALYQEYDFASAWDSAKNRKVLEKMPPFYHDPVHGEPAGHFTHFAAITGPGTAFPSEGVTMKDKSLPEWRGPGTRRIREFRDGAPLTIMVGSVSSERKIPWTKPEDVVFGPDFKSLGHADSFAAPHQRYGPFLFADGSAFAIKDHVTVEQLSSLLTINGGETVNEADIPQIPRDSPNRETPGTLRLIRTPNGVTLTFE